MKRILLLPSGRILQRVHRLQARQAQHCKQHQRPTFCRSVPASWRSASMQLSAGLVGLPSSLGHARSALCWPGTLLPAARAKQPKQVCLFAMCVTIHVCCQTEYALRCTSTLCTVRICNMCSHGAALHTTAEDLHSGSASMPILAHDVITSEHARFPHSCHTHHVTPGFCLMSLQPVTSIQ